ncbi:MAG TPA: ABC-F family ATP-binding cassette domain-containing protein [Aggregatilineales bacterium]|nr:ABC-F family ATP-binding cassette domain-containing protein [Anaerolineales bacterium]HRE48125.1 ABC-F family ATP-binding cassette domain-containing protein [Aggregatilineales bacterium]
MHVIQVDSLTINHAGRVIFRDLRWSIDDQQRVGLIGANGAGKSSLFRAIMGLVTPDKGAITRQRGIEVGYLPQEVILPAGQTVWEAANVLPPALAAVEAELRRVETALGDPAVYGDEAKLTRWLARQESALAEYERLEGARHEGRLRDTLTAFGFAAAQFALRTETLSGGQKKLVALTRLIMEQPTILLLDEPDNHLDIEAKRGLEKVISSYPGGVVIISHDRYLLDEVVTHIAALEDGKLTLYPGNYTAYTTERELRRLRQHQQYIAQQKEIARIEAAIARFEHWASIVVDERHIKQARSRRKMLERMEERGEIIERVRAPRTMDMQIAGWRGSAKMLEIQRLAMGFDDDLLFCDVTMLLRHGERVGIVGGNGVGKSVLFRLILEELTPLEGVIKRGPSTKIGYYAQEHQTLKVWAERTAIERLRDVKPMTENEAVAVLGKFALGYAQACQPIRTLSGGERSRLQLAVIMLSEPNLLLLDEPTNNLDIPSVEALENALEDFQGAILVISHDRYFLDQMVDRVVELRDGAARDYDGGYTDYLAAMGAALTK